MTIDPAAWADFLKTTAPGPDPVALARHREGAKIVAISLEALQASDEWGRLRLHVEQHIAALEADSAAVMASLVGDLVGDDLLRAVKRARDLATEIRVWREALALPERLRQRAAMESI